jgi:hypothetical protein
MQHAEDFIGETLIMSTDLGEVRFVIQSVFIFGHQIHNGFICYACDFTILYHQSMIAIFPLLRIYFALLSPSFH